MSVDFFLSCSIIQGQFAQFNYQSLTSVPKIFIKMYMIKNAKGGVLSDVKLLDSHGT